MSRPARNAAFALLVTLGFFGVAEIGARTLFAETLAEAEAPPPAPADGAPTLKGNPYLLWEQAPGVRVEHGVSAHINRLGLRGPEPEMPKPEGVRRLLSTGDSSVYGFRVADDEVFIQVAASKLGEGVEGWNAAIPGYSTYQTINMLEMRAWDLEPDVLVIANIWSDNNFDSFVDRELLSAYSTFEDNWEQRLHRWLQPSAFYRVLHYQLRVATGANAEARKVGWMVGDGTQIGRRRVEVNDYAANIERMVMGARARGADVAFVMLANEDDMRGPRREPAAWSLYREVMQDAARRHGAPLVDVPKVFRASGLSKQDLFIDEMHPTAKGHALIGEALAQTLEGWARGEALLGPTPDEGVPAYVDQFTFGDGGQGGHQDPNGPPVPQRNLNDAQLEVRGELIMPSFKGQKIQIDAVRVRDAAQPEMLGASLLDAPGPFVITLPVQEGRVGFFVYDDLTGDGPSADDVRYDLKDKTIDLGGGPIKGLRIDTAARSVTLID